METLFQQFLKEKTYLDNVSPHILRSYRAALDKFKLHNGELTKAGVSLFVVGMRESGLSPAACNVYIRAVNSFLSWLHENGHTLI